MKGTHETDFNNIEIYSRIGRLALKYTDLHFALALLYLTFNKTSKNPWQIVEKTKFKDLIYKIESALLEFRIDQSPFEELFKECIDIHKYRNKIMHSQVSYKDNEGVFEYIPLIESNENKQLIFENIDIDSIDEILKIITDLINQIMFSYLNINQIINKE